MGPENDADLVAFEALRPELVTLAYRMLGDVARAEDMVQEAWLRWSRREDRDVSSPRAFLVTVVTRLCLNELDSARARREEQRADRLPEPVDLRHLGVDPVETAEHVSMAFLVVLERLSPAERAVLLLHEVFDFAHDEIAPLVGKSAPASRKILERAREKVRAGRRSLLAPTEEHRRLLQAFLGAAWSGDIDALVKLLADDVVIVTDGGKDGRQVGRIRNLPAPLVGASRVAAFIARTARAAPTQVEERELNGRPAVVFLRDGAPFAALQIAIADGKISEVFFHGDVKRLGYLGKTSES